jgi:hypothetical protein
MQANEGSSFCCICFMGLEGLIMGQALTVFPPHLVGTTVTSTSLANSFFLPEHDVTFAFTMDAKIR